MKTLARRTSDNEQVTREVAGLQRALDESYAQFRANALAEWQRRHPEGDPSDTCVRVRIGASNRVR